MLHSCMYQRCCGVVATGVAWGLRQVQWRSMATLWVVGRPLGHAEDASPRSEAVLSKRAVDLLVCEDTRRLPASYNRKSGARSVVAYHAHSGRRGGVVDRVVRELAVHGKDVALVSDAGMPGIADPGAELVDAVWKKSQDVRIRPVPGPCALTAAIAVSGFCVDAGFVFWGFLPSKKQQRQRKIEELLDDDRVAVFYEAPHRVAGTMVALRDAGAAGRLVLCARDMTKTHEQLFRGTVVALADALAREEVPQKGEFTLVLSSRSSTGC